MFNFFEAAMIFFMERREYLILPLLYKLIYDFRDPIAACLQAPHATGSREERRYRQLR